MRHSGEITELLAAIRRGEAKAEADLVSLVYGELHAIAARCMSRERPGHTLQPTALVNETYLRLMRRQTGLPQDRVHFFATASTVMRRILVDHARERVAKKRGGGRSPVELNEFMGAVKPRLEEVLIIDEALRRLAAWEPRQARLVELVYFGGLTLQEAADALDPPVSERTAKRFWSAARAWLQAQLSSHDHRTLANH